MGILCESFVSARLKEKCLFCISPTIARRLPDGSNSERANDAKRTNKVSVFLISSRNAKRAGAVGW